MKPIFFVLFLFFGLAGFAQQEIPLDRLNDHVGDSVKVQGIISGVRFLEGAKNSPTFIKVGGAYPNQKLTVVIWGDVRSKLSLIPSSKDVGSRLVVWGRVELYKEKPQMIIRGPKQFEIIADAQKELQ